MKEIENAVKKIETEKTDVQVFSNKNTTSISEDTNTDGIVEDINQTTENNASESTNQATENTTENSGAEAANQDTDNITENSAAEATNQDTANMTENNAVESMAGNEEVNLVQEYVIEEGDTLMSISLKMYDSPNYVEEIMEANDIKEGDTIYPGRKITIPYIR
jgi:nucleoid-associated protein YgaU